MRKSKFSESQIVAILKESEAGLAVAEICRKYGISAATSYAWKSKYARSTVSTTLRPVLRNRRCPHCCSSCPMLRLTMGSGISAIATLLALAACVGFMTAAWMVVSQPRNHPWPMQLP